jgi:hypothetical protein
MKALFLLCSALLLTGNALYAHDGAHGKKDPHCAGKGKCCAAKKAATKSSASVRPAKPQAAIRRAIH